MSLMDQGLDEESFEIILVNDGSTDGSDELCRSLSDKFSRIRVLSQPNQGVSMARNLGMRESAGDYLCFVDSDNCLVHNGLLYLVPYCDGVTDMVRFWCELVDSQSSLLTDRGTGAVTFKGGGHDFLREYGLETFCWNYLYKRSFLEVNDLFFKPGILSEDFQFMFDVMIMDPQVVCVSKVVYLYYINPGSLSTVRSPARSRKWVNDMSGVMLRISAGLDSFKETDLPLYESCRRSLGEKMVPLFSRILTSDYSLAEFRSLVASMRSNGLFDFSSGGRSFKTRMARRVINVLVAFPTLLIPARWLFRFVFMPFIYARLERYR